MARPTDITPTSVAVYFLPVVTRVPLKFGPETLTTVTCARVRMTVENARGRRADGWGETPLSVQWVWPGSLRYEERHEALKAFCLLLAKAWKEWGGQGGSGGDGHSGHAMEIGQAFVFGRLPGLLNQFNQSRSGREPMPWLAALVCCSAFDVALHDAYGAVNGVPVYETYNARYMNRDLSAWLAPADGAAVSFADKYPEDFFAKPRPDSLPAWHLVGGKDAIDTSELTGGEPNDGYPLTLDQWIKHDGLFCLKVKLRGDDMAWDYARLLKVGEVAVHHGVQWLTSDFNCLVTDPAYVNAILDRLIVEQPRIYGMILYVEQPFPYDLERNRIDVHSVSARKPLFMDESAHDWRLVKLGRGLGWTGVALKTCKTQTGALLTMCWAKAHGMTLMVQDLTNPMLAQIPHVLLAAYAGTIMGVETNAMQFYPAASTPEEAVHPGLYKRRNGRVNLSSARGPGFGYRLSEIERELPEPAAAW